MDLENLSKRRSDDDVKWPSTSVSDIEPLGEGEMSEAKLAEKTINNVEDNYSFTESNATAATVFTTVTSHKSDKEEFNDAVDDKNYDEDDIKDKKGLVDTNDDEEMWDNPLIAVTTDSMMTTTESAITTTTNTTAKRKHSSGLPDPYSILLTSRVPCALPPLTTTPPVTITTASIPSFIDPSSSQLTPTSPPTNLNTSHIPTTPRPTSPQPVPSRQVSTPPSSGLIPFIPQPEPIASDNSSSPTHSEAHDSPQFTINSPSARDISQRLATHFHSKYYHEQEQYFLNSCLKNNRPPDYTRPVINCEEYNDFDLTLKKEWDGAVYKLQIDRTQILARHNQRLVDHADHHITILTSMMQAAYNDSDLISDITKLANRKGFEMLHTIGPPKGYESDNHPGNNN